MTSSAERHVETADTIEAIEECFRMGWTDGLPVVPPADYKVREMLSVAGLTGEEELLNLDMRSRVITSENAAANAVMAGCQAEYFPVLVTALKTLEEERNFVNMAASSTSSPSILMVLNGPIREALGINSRDGLFGPGFRANASIGRAVRLCFMNGFDAWPGQLDRGTLGTPAKYTFCVAENEEDSPWEPLHVSRGFDASDSVVTVAVAYNPVSVPNSYAHSGQAILLSICDALRSAALAHRYPAQWVMVIGPEHALTLQGDGWTRSDIQDFLIENSGRSRAELVRLGSKQGPERPGDEELIMRCANDPNDILIMHGGGTGGRYSAIIDTTGFRIRTRKIGVD